MTKRRPGHPGKYHYWITEEGLAQLEEWAKLGLIDRQIAHNMGISEATLYKWKQQYVEISEAIQRGKDHVDLQVVNALHREAIGYEYTEQAVTNKGDVVSVRKFARPNVAAQRFWLKNRQGWEERAITTHEGNMDIQVQDSPVEKLRERLKAIQKPDIEE